MAACDRVLTDDRFIEDALGIADAERSANGAGRAPASESLRGDTEPPTRGPRHEGPAPTVRPAPFDTADLLDQMSEAVYQAVYAAGQLPARGLPRIYLRFPEFSATKDWLGFRSLRALTEELVRRESRLRLIDTDAESWHLTLGAAGASRSEAAPASSAGSGDAVAASGAGRGDVAVASGAGRGEVMLPEIAPEARWLVLRAGILRVVRAYVASSPSPVTLASASHEVLRRLGSEVIDERWGGAGSLRDLLLDAEDPGVALHDIDGVELVVDPLRHGRPDLDGEVEEMPPPRADLPGAVNRVRQITGAPGLASAEYAALFKTIGEVLAARPFHLGPTSKLVRDVLVERGSPISRVAVTFVLRGIIYGGLSLREAPGVWTARALAQAFHRNVLALCDVAQLPLGAEERAAVECWLLGGLVAEEQGAGRSEAAAVSGAAPGDGSRAQASETPAADPAG
jgi:hypothetical protein